MVLCWLFSSRFVWLCCCIFGDWEGFTTAEFRMMALRSGSIYGRVILLGIGEICNIHTPFRLSSELWVRVLTNERVALF